MPKAFGLRLTLGGAPTTPHTIPGAPGHFLADLPRPVGGEGELSYERAKELADGPADLELVEVSDSQAKKAREVFAEIEENARKGIAHLARSRPAGAEVAQLNDERKATKEAS